MEFILNKYFVTAKITNEEKLMFVNMANDLLEYGKFKLIKDNDTNWNYISHYSDNSCMCVDNERELEQLLNCLRVFCSVTKDNDSYLIEI